VNLTNRRCERCGQIKQHYAKGMCRHCWNKDYWSKNKDKIHIIQKRYYDRNKEKRSESHRLWFQKNKHKYSNNRITLLGNPRQSKQILLFIKNKRLGRIIKKYKPLPLSAFIKSNETTNNTVD